MTAFKVNLQNQTRDVWTLVVYIILPRAEGLVSVAWQVSEAIAPGGSNGVTWTDEVCVCLGSIDPGGDVQRYRQNLAQQAAAEQAWLVTTVSDALTLTLQGRSIMPGQIEVTNKSGKMTNVALGYSGTAAVYSPNLQSGVAAGFIPTPRYQALLSQSAIKPGQVVARATAPQDTSSMMQRVSGQFLPPCALNFPDNQTEAMITLSLSGNSVSAATSYSTPG